MKKRARIEKLLSPVTVVILLAALCTCMILRAAETPPNILPEDEPDAPGQLYNLAEDPGETHNLYKKNPEIAKELKVLLDKSKSSGRSAPMR
ncbi:MAG: hypothetical protein WCS43_01140 [Verrucomicrobiota bacterium]